jgi:aminoglycoside phosphotransferase (APT) family kinase protein
MTAPGTEWTLLLTQPGREWLAQATGLQAGSLRLTEMRGATSSTLYLVEGPLGASGQRFLLRLFTLQEWLAAEPDLARHEVAALGAAAGSGVAVPQPMGFLPGPSPEGPDDPAGFGAPAVLMTHLPGRVELTPTDEGRWVRVLAETLAAIHAHPVPSFGWRYRSWVAAENVTVPAYAADRALWEAAVEAYRRWRPPVVAETFLHRDYHAMNLLFGGDGSGLRVTGVVDWVNACLGPAAADVSHCRIDLVKMKGPAAAELFLREYRAVRGGFDYDPVWDLEAVFDVAAPAADVHEPWREFGLAGLRAETVRERVEEHVRRALVEVGAI